MKRNGIITESKPNQVLNAGEATKASADYVSVVANPISFTTFCRTFAACGQGKLPPRLLSYVVTLPKISLSVIEYVPVEPNDLHNTRILTL